MTTQDIERASLLLASLRKQYIAKYVKFGIGDIVIAEPPAIIAEEDETPETVTKRSEVRVCEFKWVRHSEIVVVGLVEAMCEPHDTPETAPEAVREFDLHQVESYFPF